MDSHSFCVDARSTRDGIVTGAFFFAAGVEATFMQSSDRQVRSVTPVAYVCNHVICQLLKQIGFCNKPGTGQAHYREMVAICQSN
jgi:hypothetical protein